MRYGLGFRMAHEPWHMEMLDDAGMYRAPSGDPGPSYHPVRPKNLSGVQAKIYDEAYAYGINPMYALTIADIETGGTFNPKASSPLSSYGGLFGFNDETWKEEGLVKSDDPGEQAHAFMKRVMIRLAPHVEEVVGQGKADLTALYLAHQQGREGMRALYNNLDAPAVDALAKALGGDRAKALTHLANNVPGGSQAEREAAVKAMTAQDFINHWGTRIAQVAAKYQGADHGDQSRRPLASTYSGISGSELD